MSFKFSPAVQEALFRLPDEDRQHCFDRMQDDLGLAYQVIGALMQVNGIHVAFVHTGFPAGFDSDMDFSVMEVYRALRVQRYNVQKPGASDLSVLEIEKKEYGY